MAKHIQDKKTGQMHGSIGDGKEKIPTPGANTTVTTRHSGTSAPDYNAQHQRFTATPTNPTPPPTSVTPQRGDEPTAAAQAANITHAVTPNTLRPKPAAPAAPPATTPAGWRLSTHVIKQAAQKNIDLSAITECVDNRSFLSVF